MSLYALAPEYRQRFAAGASAHCMGDACVAVGGGNNAAWRDDPLDELTEIQNDLV